MMRRRSRHSRFPRSVEPLLVLDEHDVGGVAALPLCQLLGPCGTSAVIFRGAILPGVRRPLSWTLIFDLYLCLHIEFASSQLRVRYVGHLRSLVCVPVPEILGRLR